MALRTSHHVGAIHRAYFYMALVPICCLVGWAILILLVRQHLTESALYKALDLSLYLSTVAVAVLLAIAIRFRKSVMLLKLVTATLLCGLVLAFVTFVGYMTVGFG